MKKIFQTFLLSILVSVTAAHATYFVDIDEFDFQSKLKKGIRAVLYNLQYQKYEDITYYALDLTQDKECRIDYFPLSVFYKDKIADEIIYRDETIFNNYHIRVCGNVKHPKHFTLEKASAIKNKLNIYNNRSRGENFEIEFIDLNNASKSKKRTFFTKSGERDTLSELATTLTMISFGYKELTLQNNSDNKFDKAWINDLANPTSMVLSKSKRVENLDEREILKKLGTADNKMNQQIIHFIKQKPNDVIKFVHYIKKNGEAVCFLETVSTYNSH